jgi:hypothetical protein
MEPHLSFERNVMKECMLWWIGMFLAGWITIVLALVGAFRLYDLYIA